MKTTLLGTLLATSLLAVNAHAIPASAPQPILGEARDSKATQTQPLADSGYFQTRMGKAFADSGTFQTPQGKTSGVSSGNTHRGHMA
ncbi:hypothetical protein [Pseudomonas sp. LRF_L74]|uniref:hypothetical protein n=1 Tax=Pseudomonas sp. LRF_L74 TaxID=3369422 RepID=UPI003F5EF97F